MLNIFIFSQEDVVAIKSILFGYPQFLRTGYGNRLFKQLKQTASVVEFREIVLPSMSCIADKFCIAMQIKNISFRLSTVFSSTEVKINDLSFYEIFTLILHQSKQTLSRDWCSHLGLYMLQSK